MNMGDDTLQMLARLWVRGRGCQYFRSSAMSDDNANAVMKAISPLAFSIPDQQNSDGSLPLPGTNDNIFYRARIRPDPDYHQRNVTELWAWLPDNGDATPEQVSSVFDCVQLPKTNDEAESMGWRPVGGVSSPAGPPRHRAITALLVGLVGITAVAVLIWWWRPNADEIKNGHNMKGQGASTQPAGVNSDWQKTKGPIRQRLKDAGQTNADNIPDNSIVQDFVKLFQRPSIEKLLTEQEFAAYKRFRRSGDTHPFVEFINCLPSKIPPPTGYDCANWSSCAAAYLIPLAKELRKTCTDVDPDADPLDIVQAMLNMLDYPRFYKRWQKKNPTTDFPSDDPWCLELKGPLYRWQPPVRKLLRKQYKW